jgi:chaperone required for assembly of F1-ATPase
MSGQTGTRRFYRASGARPEEGGYAVTLDGRTVRTPGGASLVVPREALARAIAEEWEAQSEHVDPRAMPLTRLAATAIDQVAATRESLIAELVRFAETDLVCYRAEEPDELVARQEQGWQPHLDWLEESLGVRLEVTRGVIPRRQPEPSLAALRALLDDLDDLTLAGMASATPALGSLVLALGMVYGRLDPEDAFAASRIDEVFQEERWGEDAEAAERSAAVRRDVVAAHDFITLCRRAR